MIETVLSKVKYRCFIILHTLTYCLRWEVRLQAGEGAVVLLDQGLLYSICGRT